MQQTVNGSPTRYVLDPAAGLTQVLADGTNTYLYGPSAGSGQASRLAQYQGGMQYFGADGLGSVRQLYDASAVVVGSSRYDPFGNVMSQSGATSVFAFAGEQQDGTGLEYLRARYYSAIGRFAQPDSLVPNPFNPQSLNRYSYTLNNPVPYTDPTGHCDQDTNGVIDDECWLEYYQAANELGFDPSGLDQWDTADLQGLNGWLNAGVRFTSDTVAGEGTGSAWTADNLRAVMNGLGRVRSALGNGVGAALGLDRGSLTFNSWQAGWSGGMGGNYDAPINRANLYLWGGGLDQPMLDATIQTAIHEMGHVVDWFAGPRESQWAWSATSPDWLAAGQWQRVFCDSCQPAVRWGSPGVPGVSAYGNTNPGEDFAESFRSFATGTTNRISPEGRDALTSALSQFR